MAWNWIARIWEQTIGLIQDKWDRLTQNELGVTGQRERIVRLLQKHYGYQRDQAEAELDVFIGARQAGVATKFELGLRRPS